MKGTLIHSIQEAPSPGDEVISEGSGLDKATNSFVTKLISTVRLPGLFVGLAGGSQQVLPSTRDVALRVLSEWETRSPSGNLNADNVRMLTVSALAPYVIKVVLNYIEVGAQTLPHDDCVKTCEAVRIARECVVARVCVSQGRGARNSSARLTLISDWIHFNFPQYCVDHDTQCDDVPTCQLESHHRPSERTRRQDLNTAEANLEALVNAAGFGGDLGQPLSAPDSSTTELFERDEIVLRAQLVRESVLKLLLDLVESNVELWRTCYISYCAGDQPARDLGREVIALNASRSTRPRFLRCGPPPPIRRILCSQETRAALMSGTACDAQTALFWAGLEFDHTCFNTLNTDLRSIRLVPRSVYDAAQRYLGYWMALCQCLNAMAAATLDLPPTFAFLDLFTADRNSGYGLQMSRARNRLMHSLNGNIKKAPKVKGGRQAKKTNWVERSKKDKQDRDAGAADAKRERAWGDNNVPRTNLKDRMEKEAEWASDKEGMREARRLAAARPMSFDEGKAEVLTKIAAKPEPVPVQENPLYLAMQKTTPYTCGMANNEDVWQKFCESNAARVGFYDEIKLGTSTYFESCDQLRLVRRREPGEPWLRVDDVEAYIHAAEDEIRQQHKYRYYSRTYADEGKFDISEAGAQMRLGIAKAPVSWTQLAYLIAFLVFAVACIAMSTITAWALVPAVLAVYVVIGVLYSKLGTVYWYSRARPPRRRRGLEHIAGAFDARTIMDKHVEAQEPELLGGYTIGIEIRYPLLGITHRWPRWSAFLARYLPVTLSQGLSETQMETVEFSLEHFFQLWTPGLAVSTSLDVFVTKINASINATGVSINYVRANRLVGDYARAMIPLMICKYLSKPPVVQKYDREHVFGYSMLDTFADTVKTLKISEYVTMKWSNWHSARPRTPMGTRLPHGSVFSMPICDTRDPANNIAAAVLRTGRAQNEPEPDACKAYLAAAVTIAQKLYKPIPPDEIRPVGPWIDNQNKTLQEKQQLHQKWSSLTQMPWWSFITVVQGLVDAKVFVKEEVYPEAKAPRAISPVSEEQAFMVGPFCEALRTQVKQIGNAQGRFFACGMNDNEKMERLIKMKSNTSAEFWVTDFTSFEASQNQAVHAGELCLYTHTCTIPEVLEFFKYCEATTNFYRNKKVAFVLSVPSTRKSGTHQTSLGNGFVNISSLIWAISEATSYSIDEVIDRLDILIEGDDGLTRVIKHKTTGADVTKDVEAKLAAIGLTVKMEKHARFETTSFCSMHAAEDQMCIDPVKALTGGYSSLAYVQAKDDVLAGLMRAKAYSNLAKGPDAPVIASYARWVLRHTHGITIAKILTTMSRYERERVLHGMDISRKPVVTPEARELVETRFKVSVSDQIKLEEYFDTDCSGIFPDEIFGNILAVANPNVLNFTAAYVHKLPELSLPRSRLADWRYKWLGYGNFFTDKRRVELHRAMLDYGLGAPTQFWCYPTREMLNGTWHPGLFRDGDNERLYSANILFGKKFGEWDAARYYAGFMGVNGGTTGLELVGLSVAEVAYRARSIKRFLGFAVSTLAGEVRRRVGFAVPETGGVLRTTAPPAPTTASAVPQAPATASNPVPQIPVSMAIDAHPPNPGAAANAAAFNQLPGRSMPASIAVFADAVDRQFSGFYIAYYYSLAIAEAKYDAEYIETVGRHVATLKRQSRLPMLTRRHDRLYGSYDKKTV